jgi:hypothetical protein
MNGGLRVSGGAQTNEGVRGLHEGIEPNVRALACVSAEPPHGGTFEGVGLAIPDHDADRQRVEQGHIRKLAGGGPDDAQVLRFQRPLEPRVWGTAARHGAGCYTNTRSLQFLDLQSACRLGAMPEGSVSRRGRQVSRGRAVEWQSHDNRFDCLRLGPIDLDKCNATWVGQRAG